MHTFIAASHQALHPAKTVGAIGAQCVYPPSIHGICMVPSTSALSIVFHRFNIPPTVDWDKRLQHMASRLSRLSGLVLSAFGRGQASAAYAASSILYAAEFVPIPPPDYEDSTTVDPQIRGQRPSPHVHPAPL